MAIQEICNEKNRLQFMFQETITFAFYKIMHWTMYGKEQLLDLDIWAKSFYEIAMIVISLRNSAKTWVYLTINSQLSFPYGIYAYITALPSDLILIISIFETIRFQDVFVDQNEIHGVTFHRQFPEPFTGRDNILFHIVIYVTSH